MEEYGDHIDVHHIIQDAMNIVNRADKVNNMIIAINVIEKGVEGTKTYDFISGSNYGNIGLCDCLKHTLLNEMVDMGK